MFGLFFRALQWYLYIIVVIIKDTIIVGVIIMVTTIIAMTIVGTIIMVSSIHASKSTLQPQPDRWRKSVFI